MDVCDRSIAPEAHYLAIEIGGTKQQAAVGTGDGRILERRQVKLGTETTAPRILGWILDTAREFQTRWDIRGIGAGFGGPLDPDTGVILCSLQVEGWEHFPLRDWFRDTFSLPCAVLNDTVTGGLGELYCGAGQGSRRLFYTNIGTGIGGGLYWPGGFGASSLGYAWVPDWTASEPGAATRLEYLCAGPFIEKRLNTPGYLPRQSCLAPGVGSLTCLDLARGRRSFRLSGAGPGGPDVLPRAGGHAGAGLPRPDRHRRRRGKNGRDPLLPPAHLHPGIRLCGRRGPLSDRAQPAHG